MVVEEILAETVMRSDMTRVMERLESVDGMEARLYKELVGREGKRRKQARLALRIEKEAMWLARRKDAGKQKMLSGAGANPDGIHQTDLIE